MRYDVIIVGAGPAGLAVSIAAHDHGLQFLLIDKGGLVHSIHRFPEFMVFFSSSDRLEIGKVPFPSPHRRPTRQEALEYYRKVADHYQLPIHLYERVISVEGQWPLLHVHTDKGSYLTQAVVLATGFYDTPNQLGVEGEQLPHVLHYYHSPYPFYRQNVVIVGAGNSAVQAALECWQRGAKVTMVIRDSDFHKSVKYWLLPDIQNRINEGAIQAFFRSHIHRIFPDAVEITTPQGRQRLAAHWVLALIGYRPDYSFLEKVGVKWEGPDWVPSHNPHTLESNVPGIYLAGSILGGLRTNQLFIENTRHHGELIIADIVRRRASKSD